MSLLRSPVKIECVSESTRVTACGGSALLLEMLIASRALADLPVDAGTPSRGWTDGQLILTVMLLKADEAPGRLVRESEPAVLGIARRRIKRRFRGGRERNFPSTRLLGQWLDRFHDTELHRTHPAGEAVARPDGPRHGLLREVNRRLVALGAGLAKAETATIDLDATIIGSGKRDCHYAYRAANRTVPGERGYQPLVAYVGELDMAPWLEMRDGNVPASFENRRGLEATLRQLPKRIRRATLRTDGTGYQEEVFRFCNDPAGRPADPGRFGVIGLFCGATRSEELMAEAKRLPEAAWQPLHKPEGRPGSEGRSKPGDDGDIVECAELPFVSNMTARARPGHVIRTS